MPTPSQVTRKAVQTGGQNRFGGAMRLLGTYHSSEGYLYQVLSVGEYTWLFQYLGDGGQAVNTSGQVTGGQMLSAVNGGYTAESGYPFTSTVYAEVFKWTTGSVRVTALEGTFPTILERRGYDARTAMEAGMIQLVSPMLTRWVGVGETSTAAIGIMKLNFAPEPTRWLALGSGVLLLALLYRSSRMG